MKENIKNDTLIYDFSKDDNEFFSTQEKIKKKSLKSQNFEDNTYRLSKKGLFNLIPE